MFIEDPLSCFARRPLVVEFFTHTINASFHGIEVLPVTVKLSFDVGYLVGQAAHLGRERTDLIRYDPYGLYRPIEVVSHIRGVVILDFLIRALSGVAGLRGSG